MLDLARRPRPAPGRGRARRQRSDLSGGCHGARPAGLSPPGDLVDVGGYRLHLLCTGSQTAGHPTVVLDASFPGTVSTWAWVQPKLAQATRVCAYDRAGLGWSDAGPAPRDALSHARELHTLLQHAQVAGPYVLVGHSLGGLSVRMYADQYPEDVAGMVLIEGTNPEAWRRLGKPEGVGVDRTQLAVAPFLARLGIFRLRPDPGAWPRSRSAAPRTSGAAGVFQHVHLPGHDPCR